jgi:hypothetical protein
VIVSGALLAVTLLLDAGAAGASADAGAPDAAVDRGEAGADAGEAGAGDAVAAPAPAPAPATPPPLGRVVGRVLARGTRAPVADASLTADTSAVGATDAHGDFAVDVPCGPHRLTVQAPGFERLTADVDACGATPPPPLTLRLTPTTSRPAYEAVVRAKPAQPSVRIANEELTQTPGTLGDPFRVIETLPGVTTIAWPAPIYAVRGSNPGNTGFFLDGIRVPALFHFALGPSVIHPYFFDDLEFYPGGYPARFGRYAAGIITADTRAPATDRPHASVDVRLYDAGALVSAPLPGNGAVAVAGRYSYTALLVSLLDPDVSVAYWDYQVRVDRRVGPFQLTLLAFGSNDVLTPKLSNSVREVALGFHRVSLRALAPLGGGRVQGSIALGADHTRAPILDDFPVIVDAVNAAPRLAYLRSWAAADLAVGFDGELGRYDPVVIGTLHPPSNWDIGQRRDAYLLAGYASTTVRAGPGLTVTPELRLDTYDVSGAYAQDLAPRLTARAAVRDDTTLKLAGGRFTQLPSLPLQIPGADAFGLRLLGLQSSWQASLGAETTHFRALELTVTGYVQRYVLTDLRDPRPLHPDPLADDFLINRDALSYGLEVLARRPLAERLYGWVSYTLSYNLRSFGGGAIGPSDWDQRHVLNVVAGYRWGNTTFGGRAHFNTGRPFILYNTLYTGDTEYIQRLPAFYQIDLRVDRRIVFDRFLFDFYVELVNATLSRQVYALDEPQPGMVTQESFRLVLPSIGVRAEF